MTVSLRKTRSIFKGHWIDINHNAGFKSVPGIYLLCPGSNSAYGNYQGGFANVSEAEDFKTANGLSTFTALPGMVGNQLTLPTRRCVLPTFLQAW